MKPATLKTIACAICFVCSIGITAKTNAQTWSLVTGIVAQDIAVGASGAVWATANNGDIYRWDTTSWQRIPGGASRIAVDAAGTAWIVTDAGDVYKYNATTNYWEVKPGNAKDIAAGRDGSVWMTGGDGSISKWD